MSESVAVSNHRPAEAGLSFLQTVQRLSGQELHRCYFCQKCSAGCPIAYIMDHPPARLIKLIQLGRREAVLNSSAIWLCVGCETCATRCPNEIAAAPVMDALKQLALAEGRTAAGRKSLAFHRAFVDSIRLFGRVHEITMLAEYKLRSRDLLSDLDLGLQMFLRNKLALRPERVDAVGDVRRLLAAFQREEER